MALADTRSGALLPAHTPLMRRRPDSLPSPRAVTLTAGQTKTLNIAMQIQTEQQQVQVEAEAPTVDTSPDQNANAVVIKGKDLDALSDDPDELENQLQALAGRQLVRTAARSILMGLPGGKSAEVFHPRDPREPEPIFG